MQDLTEKKCKPCEGGVDSLSPEESEAFLKQIPKWKITEDGIRIRREWVVKNFMTAIHFFNEVASIAEGDGHHPDIHLSQYRSVAIELWTHAIGGLSENDFIVASKIDQVPVELVSQSS